MRQIWGCGVCWRHLAALLSPVDWKARRHRRALPGRVPLPGKATPLPMGQFRYCPLKGGVHLAPMRRSSMGPREPLKDGHTINTTGGVT